MFCYILFLFAAAKTNYDQHFEVIELLIENGANIHDVDSYYQRTPAHWACFYNLPKILMLLINASR